MEETVMTDELAVTENSEAVANENAEAEAKAKAKEKKKNKTKKAVITTTYFIAVLCLIAGLLVPLFNYKNVATPGERMMLRYIPAMLKNIFGQPIIPITGWFLPFEGAGGKFDFMSLVGVMYVIVVVITLILSIFVFLGSKKKNTSANAALIGEILAILVTGAYIATAAYNIVASGTVQWNDYNFLIPFGGVLLMAIIQTVCSKGSIGVSKVIAVIFSAIGVFALCDITLFIPQLKEPLSKFSETVHCGKDIGFIFGLTSPNGTSTTILGIDGLNILLNVKNVWSSIIAPAGSQPDVYKIVIYILIIAICVFTLLNLVVDVIGLGTGKKFKKNRAPARNGASNTFALVRYILTFIFALAAVLLILFVPSLKSSVNVGIYLYVLIAVLFIEIINAAVRTAVANARCKAGKPAPKEEAAPALKIEDDMFTEPVKADEVPAYTEPAYTEPVYQQPDDGFVANPDYSEPAYQQPYAEQPAYEQPAYTEQPAYSEPVYQQPAEDFVSNPEYVPEDYTPAIETEPYVAPEPLTAPLEEPEEPAACAEPTTIYYYNGETDEFMDTLTDSEKVEFVEMFVKRSKGTVNGVAAYEINGDNSDFFPSVFVHINRYRNIVSDALMTKLYKQLGKAQ